jgi:hypothetical protein
VTQAEKVMGHALSLQERAERIIRNHETFCIGHASAVEPWCSASPDGTPLCDSCRRLADSIVAEFRLAQLADRESRDSCLQYELLDLIKLMPDSQVDEILSFISTLRDARAIASGFAPSMFTKNPDGDWVCEHGTASDVHCCGCHSGFLFDRTTCTCGVA